MPTSTTRGFRRIHAEEEAYVDYSHQLPCPLCGTHFSLINCHGGKEQWDAKKDDEYDWDAIHVVDCPCCHLRVRHQVATGFHSLRRSCQFWSIEPGQVVEYDGSKFEIGHGKLTIQTIDKKTGGIDADVRYVRPPCGTLITGSHAWTEPSLYDGQVYCAWCGLEAYQDADGNLLSMEAAAARDDAIEERRLAEGA